MRVLVACEESQAVCIAFREMGHEAYSCDILPCSGGHPEWHIQGDVMEVINDGWDMMIAFPPCTHLAVSGARHFEQKRKDGRQQQGVDFFLSLTRTPIKRWAIENPVGIMSKIYRRPDQIIQPYHFGHGETKKTCLWLNDLPPLIYTSIATGRNQRVWKLPPSPDRGKIRSKTFPGIAKAMAQQWGSLALIIAMPMILLTSCTINHYQQRAQVTGDRVQLERCESYRETVWNAENNRPGEQDSIMNEIKQNHK